MLDVFILIHLRLVQVLVKIRRIVVLVSDANRPNPEPPPILASLSHKYSLAAKLLLQENPLPPTVADSGATNHFFDHKQMVHLNSPLINVNKHHKPISAILPNGETITSTHKAEIDIPGLPLTARIAYIFPHLASGSLIYIGQLCDAALVGLTSLWRLMLSVGRPPRQLSSIVLSL